MKSSIDERRAAVRARIERTEHEMLRWERARVAAQCDEERAAAVLQLGTLRRRWERDREKLNALRDQLTLPWLGGKEGRRAS